MGIEKDKFPPRLVLAKIGLDGHDRGAKVIARALRDAGFEIIYTGLHNTAAQVARIAAEEDADGVGVSVLSGAHMTVFADLLSELSKLGVNDICLFGGGIISDTDVLELKELGVKEIFTPGAGVDEIVLWVSQNVLKRVVK